MEASIQARLSAQQMQEEVQKLLEWEASIRKANPQSNPETFPIRNQSIINDSESIKDSLIHQEKALVYFRNKNYTKAIHHFSKQIEIQANSKAYSNRSLCYMKLEKFQECIDDCERVLQEDPKSIKCLWRMGVAQTKLGVFKEAVQKRALVLEPTNVNVKKDLGDAKSALDKLTGRVKPVVEEAVQRRVVEVLEVGDADLFKDESDKIELAEVSSRPLPKTQIDSVHEKNDGNDSSRDLASRNDITEKGKTMNSSKSKVKKDVNVPIITNTHTFEQVFRQFKNNSEVLKKALFSIPTDSYKELFNSSFSVTHLNAILQVLNENREEYGKDFCINVLNGLKSIHRYNLVIKMMSRKEKDFFNDVSNICE